MPKIITVTANSAIDLFLEIEGLGVQDNIQAKSSIEFACGKGVNVARAITVHGAQAVCLGFVGRQSLPTFNSLKSGPLQTDFTIVPGKTRTNITLFDDAANNETHIRTAGYSVAVEDSRALQLKLKALLKAGDVVVLSGSLPSGAGDDFYAGLIEICHRKGALAILDSSGAGLKTGLSAKPYLIKPNQHELEELVGESLCNEQAIVSAAGRLIEQGMEWVYVSRGRQGVIAVGREQALAANIPVVPEGIVTHVGCGDAMVAGLALALMNSDTPEQTLRAAVASGVANLYCREPGLYDLPLQTALLEKVEIRSL